MLVFEIRINNTFLQSGQKYNLVHVCCENMTESIIQSLAVYLENLTGIKGALGVGNASFHSRVFHGKFMG